MRKMPSPVVVAAYFLPLGCAVASTDTPESPTASGFPVAVGTAWKTRPTRAPLAKRCWPGAAAGICLEFVCANKDESAAAKKNTAATRRNLEWGTLIGHAIVFLAGKFP